MTIALLCLLLLAPLLLTEVPPLLDYPNHLARAVVLANPTDPFLSRMYAANWAVIPNLYTDLLLPPLLHILPVHIAGRIVVGGTLLLPVLGTLAYSRAVHGRVTWWSLGVALVAYNGTLLFGFLNFNASIGLALLLAAAWIAWRDARPEKLLPIAWLGIVGLFFCHLAGIAFFFVLIAGHELAWLWRHRTQHGSVAKRLAVLLVLLTTAWLLYAQSPFETAEGGAEFASLADKLRQLLLPFANYVLALDIATAVLCAGFLLTCRLAFTPAVAVGLLVLLYAAAPFALKGTYFLDTRFVIMLGLLMFAAACPRLPRRPAIIAACGFAGLFIARMAVLCLAWQAQQRDVEDMRAVIAAVPPGSAVYVTAVTPEEAPAYWDRAPHGRRLSTGMRLDVHLPALLPMERRAFWPFQFDNASQQPIRTLPPYAALALQAETMRDHGAIAVESLCGYDFLLLLDAGGEPNLAGWERGRLALVAARDIAALYRINPTRCASATPPRNP